MRLYQNFWKSTPIKTGKRDGPWLSRVGLCVCVAYTFNLSKGGRPGRSLNEFKASLIYRPDQATKTDPVKKQKSPGIGGACL